MTSRSLKTGADLTPRLPLPRGEGESTRRVVAIVSPLSAPERGPGGEVPRPLLSLVIVVLALLATACGSPPAIESGHIYTGGTAESLCILQPREAPASAPPAPADLPA